MSNSTDFSLDMSQLFAHWCKKQPADKVFEWGQSAADPKDGKMHLITKRFDEMTDEQKKHRFLELAHWAIVAC